MSLLARDQEKNMENTVTCTVCGKFVAGNPLGTHWICEDCRYEPDKPPKNNEK